ncbi:MAG: TlyA family RNA methyltransferase [Kiritimatiellia bacterium]|nr:TlyA family RNA methyltransferase [Kiritimatiellia bacterium]
MNSKENASSRVRQIRLDQLVVERGLAESREKAQRTIRAGEILLEGHPATKPGNRVREDAVLVRKTPERFVGRGGEKLAEAFRVFPMDVRGLTCLDVGASTGGFTDCLLQQGALRVYAVDVGRGQLDARLRARAEVISREGCNARYLERSDFPEPIHFAVADVSFISLKKILPAICRIVEAGSGIVTLIKPQFEAGREDVGRGGVVRDSEVHRRVVEDLRTFGETELALIWLGCCPSPIRGPAGNVEFVAYWKAPPG